MILAALNQYYERLKNDPDSGIPMLGFSRQKIHFALVLAKDGRLLQVMDLRTIEGKKAFPKILVVPEPVKNISVLFAPRAFAIHSRASVTNSLTALPIG